MKNGLEDQYVIKNNKRLRYGYTTGSCAAGAARGAVRMLLSGETLSEVELDTPKGITLTLQLHDITRGETYVSCAVQKDAGDDPDTTNGILVYVKRRSFLFQRQNRPGRSRKQRDPGLRLSWTEGSVWGVSPSRDFPRTWARRRSIRFPEP